MGTIWSVAFSPDGHYLASGGGYDDRTIKLWRVSDGALVRTLTGHTSSVNSVAFSPDGRYLASGSDDRTIRLWRVSDGALVRTLTGHTDWVSSVAFSPDGQYLASGSDDRTIRLWRVSDGALLRTYDQETGTGVRSIQFSPNGRFFGYGRKDATVVLARNPFGSDVPGNTAPAAPSNLSATALSSTEIRLTWRDNSNNETGFIIERRREGGSFTPIICIPVNVTSWTDTSVLPATTYTYRVRAFNAVGSSGYSNEASATPPAGTSPTGNFQYLPANLHVHTRFSCCPDHFGADSPQNTMSRAQRHDIHVVGFSDHGGHINSSEWEELGNASDGVLVHTLTGHAYTVYSVAFSPDGQYLASGSYDRTIKLWRVADGALIGTIRGHTNEVLSVAFSPDGQYLASGSSDYTIKLWRVSDGALLHTLTGHGGFVRSVAFSPDGQYLASGSGDRTIKLWRVSDGVLVRTLTGHTDPVLSVAFSPDGHYLASGSGDTTVKLWRVSDGAFVRILIGHTGPVYSVAFSPNGQYLASGSGDRTIRLWRVSDGMLVRILIGHTGPVYSVAFSPNGQHLASGSGDDTIKLWRRVFNTYSSSPIALRGFEWTGSDHVNVFGTRTWTDIGDFGDGQPPTHTTTLNALFDWLNDPNNWDIEGYGGSPVAQFNHVWLYQHFNDFTGDASWQSATNGRQHLDDIFCLIELAGGNWPRNGRLNTSEPWYNSALMSGWRVGPAIGVDNLTGLDAEARINHTGVYVDRNISNPRHAVMDAFRNRRVFASEDKNSTVKFMVQVEGDPNWYWMGSDLLVPPNFRLRFSGETGNVPDNPRRPERDLITRVELVANNGVVLWRVNTATMGFCWGFSLSANDLSNLRLTARDEYYFYVRVVQNDGDWVLSAPIWVKVVSGGFLQGDNPSEHLEELPKPEELPKEDK